MADYSDLVQRLRNHGSISPMSLKGAEKFERYWFYETLPPKFVDDAADAIEELEAEVEKLKQLLNDGHSSLLKENEHLRWKCAAQESYEWLLRKQND